MIDENFKQLLIKIEKHKWNTSTIKIRENNMQNILDKEINKKDIEIKKINRDIKIINDKINIFEEFIKNKKLEDEFQLYYLNKLADKIFNKVSK